MISLSLVPLLAFRECPGAYYSQWMGTRDDVVTPHFCVAEDFVLGNH